MKEPWQDTHSGLTLPSFESQTLSRCGHSHVLWSADCGVAGVMPSQASPGAGEP
jgi:hypothetical protein